MNRIILATILFVGIITNLHAQEISSESDTLMLDFGFPTIKSSPDIQFIDENDNNNIDPEETCVISFTITNVSKYLAKDLSIHPNELNNIEGLDLQDEIFFGNIKPGESRVVQIGIASNENLEQGTASLIFYIHENGKINEKSIVYAVGTGVKE